MGVNHLKFPTGFVMIFLNFYGFQIQQSYRLHCCTEMFGLFYNNHAIVNPLRDGSSLGMFGIARNWFVSESRKSRMVLNFQDVSMVWGLQVLRSMKIVTHPLLIFTECSFLSFLPMGVKRRLKLIEKLSEKTAVAGLRSLSIFQ